MWWKWQRGVSRHGLGDVLLAKSLGESAILVTSGLGLIDGLEAFDDFRTSKRVPDYCGGFHWAL